MSILTMLFALATVIATGLALLAVRAAAPVPQKVGALVLAAALLPLGYLAMAELLSRSKPVALEWWRAEAEEATVVASHLRPEEGIHLWLLLEGAEEPRAFVLPWDRELAEALHEAEKQARENGTGVRMRLPFEPSLDDREPKFYALPQPALPPKDRTDPPAQRFEAPGTDA